MRFQPLLVSFVVLASSVSAQVIYTDDYNSDTILAVSSGSGNYTTVESGFTPGNFAGQQMTYGYGGNIYVAEDSGNQIYRFSPNGGPVSTFGTPVAGTLTGITYDASTASLYVTDYGSGDIYKVNSDGSYGPSLANIGGNPSTVTTDGAGHLYVAGGNNSTTGNPTDLYSINESTGAFTDIGTTNSAGIVYAGGHLYGTNGSTGGITEYDLSGNEINFWATTGSTNTQAITADASGNIFAGDGQDGIIYELSAGGSLSVFASNLPSGPGLLNGMVVEAVPEPSMWALVAGAAVLGACALKRRRMASA